MTLSPILDRRALNAMVAGVVLAPGCARPPSPVMVNLAQPGEAGAAELGAGADAARRMTVPVGINGKGPFEFVVDSGANHSVISAEAAAVLDLPSAGTANVHGIAGAEPAPTVLAARLTMGEIAVRRLRMPVLPKSRLGVDGLLGVDALKGRRVRLDFRANRLTIAPRRSGFDLPGEGGGGSRLAAGGPLEEVVVPARFRFGQLIIIDADLGGLPVVCFLDSGSQNTVGNLALRRVMAGAFPGLVERRIMVHLLSATGQTAYGEQLPTPALRIGGLRVGNLSAVFADLHVFRIWDLLETPALLLGVDVMRHFASVDLDFAGRRVIFRVSPRRAPGG